MKTKLFLGAMLMTMVLGASIFAAPAKKPMITMEQAQEIALKRVSGTIEQADLVKDHYSIFVKVSDQVTTHEIISAKNGKILSLRDESPATAKVK